MASRKSSITAELKLAGKGQFKSGLNEAGRDARAFGKSMESIGGKGIGSSMRLTELHSGLQLAGSAARMAGSAFKSAFSKDLNVEQLAMGLASVSDGTETLAQQFAALKEAAKMPGLGFTEIAKGSLDLQSVGVEAAASREIIINLGNALANAGKGKDALEGITTALAQMYGKGKVSAEEINQIAERYPKIRGLLAGLDMNSPSKFTEGLSKELAKMPRATGTAKDAIDNLGDAWDQLSVSISGGKLNDAIKSIGQGAADALSSSELSEAAEKLGKGVRGAFSGGSDSPLAKYELSAEEIAKRQEAKRAAAEAEQLQKEQILESELEIIRAENELADAKTKNKESDILLATQELAILKERKKLMETIGISEQQATEFIRDRVSLELQGDKITRDAEQRNQRKKSEDELAMLEAQAGGASERKLKELEKTQRLGSEEDRLLKEGRSPAQAKEMARRKVEAEDRIATDSQRAEMGLRPRIRGAGRGGENRRTGLGSESYTGLIDESTEFQGLDALARMQPDPAATQAKIEGMRKPIKGAGAKEPKQKDDGAKPSTGVGGDIAKLIAATERVEKAVLSIGPSSNDRAKPLSTSTR